MFTTNTISHQQLLKSKLLITMLKNEEQFMNLFEIKIWSQQWCAENQLSSSLLLPQISSDNKFYNCPFSRFSIVKGDLQKKWTELLEFTLGFKNIVQKFPNFFVKRWQNNSTRKNITALDSCGCKQFKQLEFIQNHVQWYVLNDQVQ